MKVGQKRCIGTSIESFTSSSLSEQIIIKTNFNKFAILSQTDLKLGKRALMSYIRADQNTGVALFEFSMRTVMHRASSVSSAISVYDN